MTYEGKEEVIEQERTEKTEIGILELLPFSVVSVSSCSCFRLYLDEIYIHDLYNQAAYEGLCPRLLI